MTKDIEKEAEQKQAQSNSCFVIMPISDADGYELGHFDRVYNYIIKPACEKAGFSANRADKTNKTNYIVIDILKQIINCDMAICDLSSRNSNVFFELGLRQAFNLKTVLIKDSKTPRSFDISGLRCIDYDENLRVDNVESIIEQISTSLKETMSCKGDEVNSLIQLLAVDAAKLPERVKVSDDTGMILMEIQRLRDDMNHMYSERIRRGPIVIPDKPTTIMVLLPNGESAFLYTKLYLKTEDATFYDEFGELVDRRRDITVIKKGDEFIKVKDDDLLWKKLTIKDSAF